MVWGNPAMAVFPLEKLKSMVAASSTKLGASVVTSITEALESTWKATGLQHMLEG